MRATSSPRWAISFADLALLLLGCLVMLYALRLPAPASSAPALHPDLAVELAAGDLFDPGEARLSAAGRDRLAAIARQAAGARVRIASRGRDRGGERLDSFELAAARTAAVSRALAVDEDRLSVSIDAAGSGAEGQRISIGIQR